MSCLPDLLIDHGLFGFPFFTSLARMMIEFEGQIFIRYILVNNEDLTPLTPKHRGWADLKWKKCYKLPRDFKMHFLVLFKSIFSKYVCKADFVAAIVF